MLDELLFEQQKKIKKWKKKHTDVYAIGLQDAEEEFYIPFIFRTLGREEYKFLFLNFISDMPSFQERVCELAVLYPKNYDFSNGYAGFPEVLSNLILEVSGFAEGQALQLLASYREQMYEYDFQVDCMIHEAFPEFSIEEIQMWNNHKTMYYLSRAEFILAGIRGQNIVTMEDIISQAMDLEQEAGEEIKKQETGYDNSFFATPKQEVYPEFQEQFNKMDTQDPVQPQTNKQEKQNGVMSEAELMRILGQNEASNGRKISNPAGEQGLGNSKMFPELAWFKAESDLKGEFD